MAEFPYLTRPALQQVPSVRQQNYPEPPPPLEGEQGFIGPLPPTEAEQAAMDAERANAASAYAMLPERAASLKSLSFTPWWPDGQTRVLSSDELNGMHAKFNEHARIAGQYLDRGNAARFNFLWDRFDQDPNRVMRTHEIKEYAALFGYELRQKQGY